MSHDDIKNHKISNDPKTFLNNDGYNIQTKYLPKSELNKIEKNLTLIPHVPDATPQELEKLKYTVFKYNESKSIITVPRYYGISRYGTPQHMDFDEAEEIDMEFTKTLRPKQKQVVDLCLQYMEQNGGGLLSVPCGFGKCLAKGTHVLMYDGTLKEVQDIEVGELLMGDDSTPRKVLSLASGTEQMFEICDETYGESYTVNRSHIISVKYNYHIPILIKGNVYGLGDIINISIQDIMELGLADIIISRCVGYRTKPEFSGSHDKSRAYSLQNLTHSDVLCSALSRKKILKSVLYDLLNLELDQLNNFMFFNHSLDIRIESNHPGIHNLPNLIFLVRSLGYGWVNVDKANGKYQIIFKDCTTYRIGIYSKGEGEYYGFEINKNRLFVLGDLTVTHNTVCALYIAAALGLKTLVVVHKSFLLQQWIDRALEFLNITREQIGIIQQMKCGVEGKDLVIGMIHTMSKREYNKLYKQFGLVIYDEAHHVPARYYSRTLLKTSSRYTLALTATPYRGDGLIKVMYWFAGGTIYREKMKINKNVVVKVIHHKSTDRRFRFRKRWFRGKMVPNTVSMISDFINISSRNAMIIKMITHLRRVYPERKILILSERIEHLEILKKGVDKEIKDDIDAGKIDRDDILSCYYIGKSTPRQREEAEERGDLIFATYGMANEGLDIKHLNTLLFASPKKDVVQTVGRIMRTILKSGDVRPMIIDIQDDIDLFRNWATKRNDYYVSCKYNSEEYYLKDELFMTGNTYYGIDSIEDKDRKRHCRCIKIHKQINALHTEYFEFRELLREFEDTCAKIDATKQTKILKIKASEYVSKSNKSKSGKKIDPENLFATGSYDPNAIIETLVRPDPQYITDEGLDEKYNLKQITDNKIKILEDFEPYEMEEILHLDKLTERDFDTEVLKKSDPNAKLDLEGDIRLGSEDDMAFELIRHRGRQEIKMNKMKTRRLV